MTLQSRVKLIGCEISAAKHAGEGGQHQSRSVLSGLWTHSSLTTADITAGGTGSNIIGPSDRREQEDCVRGKGCIYADSRRWQEG